MDLEKGSSTPYVRAGDDISYSTDASSSSGYGRNVLMNFNVKEALGALTKNQIIFFVLCVVLMVRKWKWNILYAMWGLMIWVDFGYFIMF